MDFFADNGQGLLCSRFTSPHGGRMPFSNLHPHWELYFCAQPLEQLTFVNGTITTYTSPLAILITPFSQHSTQVFADTPYIRDVFYFGEDFLATVPPPLFSLEAYAGTTACFFPMRDEVAATLTLLVDQIRSADSIGQMLLFALFFHQLEAAVPTDARCYIGSTNGYIQDAMRYIVDHLDQSLTIPALAAHFFVSRDKLGRDFRTFTGTTVHQFIVNLRLARACELLQSTPTLSITEAAQRCGFANPYYFTDFFKAHTGQTPSQYSKEKQKKKTVI